MYKKTNKPRSQNWIDKTTYGYDGRPTSESEVKDKISIKALKDLPKSSYALKADPYQAALPTSEPYPILNRFNRVVGGEYGGDDNIDGGNVQQYANSTTSNFLKSFDEIRTKINANYRYLPIFNATKAKGTAIKIKTFSVVTFLNRVFNLDSLSVGRVPLNNLYEFTYNSGWYLGAASVTLADFGITLDEDPSPSSSSKISVTTNLVDYAGIQLIDEMRKSIAETVSILQSTTFTQMAINRFAIVTDLPLGTARTKDISYAQDGSVMAYTDLTDVLYGMSIYYQLFLQNGLNVMNWHNSFRIKQGTAIRNAFNREVPSLNAFFGLMNKKAFLSMLDSINLSFEGEYIDKEFMEQMNMLTLMPSRRSNSISDPVLELQCGFNRPTYFEIYTIATDTGRLLQNQKPFFTDAMLKLPIHFEGELKDVSFWDACDSLRDYLSLEATQRWARSTFTPAGINKTDTARYNQIKDLFDVIVNSFTIFKPLWADFREAFDVMARTGTISWTKGFRPSVIKDTDAALFWNVLVDHIYQFIFSGAHKLDYDDATKRWRTFSLWNMYSGIPSYDLKSGGAFLTLSFKALADGVDTAEQYEYLPTLFNNWETAKDEIVCVALSRDGKEAIIDQYYTNIQNNVVLNRLAPLASQNGLEIRVPTVAYAKNDSLESGHFSNLYKTLCQIFGSCRIQNTEDGAYDVALDPDILSIYQIEISDITNMAITYARANAPFRGTTSKEGTIGFATITKK